MRLTNFARLTKRQLEVLELGCAQGMSNPQTAATLGISDQTVKNHLTAAYRTLDCRGARYACFLFGVFRERHVQRTEPAERPDDI